MLYSSCACMFEALLLGVECGRWKGPYERDWKWSYRGEACMARLAVTKGPGTPC